MNWSGEREETSVRVHARVWDGMWRARNWFQLARFALVGLSGYVVNLTLFGLALRVLSLHHLAAATIAFVCAVSNNFLWNRRWTFDARTGRAERQAARFLVVSTTAFMVAAIVLDVLVRSTELPPLLAQAGAIGLMTPFSFVGNKMWTFGPERADALQRHVSRPPGLR